MHLLTKVSSLMHSSDIEFDTDLRSFIFSNKKSREAIEFKFDIGTTDIKYIKFSVPKGDGYMNASILLQPESRSIYWEKKFGQFINPIKKQGNSFALRTYQRSRVISGAPFRKLPFNRQKSIIEGELSQTKLSNDYGDIIDELCICNMKPAEQQYLFESLLLIFARKMIALNHQDFDNTLMKDLREMIQGFENPSSNRNLLPTIYGLDSKWK